MLCGVYTGGVSQKRKEIRWCCSQVSDLVVVSLFVVVELCVERGCSKGGRRAFILVGAVVVRQVSKRFYAALWPNQKLLQPPRTCQDPLRTAA